LLNLRGEGKNSREGSGLKIGGGRTGDGEGTMEEYNEGGRHPPLPTLLSISSLLRPDTNRLHFNDQTTPPPLPIHAVLLQITSTGVRIHFTSML